ncbi:carbonic anhydrase [Methylobacterium nonmethylotrophicum]|uniref:Carbonic anhydrase n=1 Tax=Methylobacterium nonmethylotrophicum TaxID=1141884 RepID=A0A4Z0NE26_9HYPH|nr:carbonic anhydrase [Methylobacterium nonmethylotrophicum]TGD92121.1 carbonic anhydrase [Methylobacterium nonmethylotrophicum]
MDNIVQGFTQFREQVFPSQRSVYQRLVHDGQQPKALVISCADSRVVPELITQAGPGELFVTRNVGNIVPPFATMLGGVTAAVEYAVLALKVRDIVICGHSDCGAMKGLLAPDLADTMPNVAAWLRHGEAARKIVCDAYPDDIDDRRRLHALAMENVLAQLNHLRTHPAVASALAAGELTLHGWFFEIETGHLLVYDGEAGRFVVLAEEDALPVAEAAAAPRLAAVDVGAPETRAAE